MIELVSSMWQSVLWRKLLPVHDSHNQLRGMTMNLFQYLANENNREKVIEDFGLVINSVGNIVSVFLTWSGANALVQKK